MASNAPVVLIPTTFPEGYCPANWQALANAIASGMAGYVPGTYTFFNYGNSEPAPADRDKPWLRLNADGSPDKFFVYWSGVWASQNATPALGSERIIWVGSEADLWAYDGGDGTDPTATPPTATTGAMWVRDTIFDFRIPMGVGTNTVVYDGNPATAIAVGGTAGEERHELLAAESPEHDHFVAKASTVGSSAGSVGATEYVARYFDNDNNSNDNRYQLKGTTSEADVGLTSPTGGDSAGDTTSHQNLPPVIGVFFGKRSVRSHYTV